MKLGFVSAILPDYTLEQVLAFARQEGFSSVEVMCWPPGKSQRRYAGVTHIDATKLSLDDVEKIQDLLAIHSVAISGLGYYPNPLAYRSGRLRGLRHSSPQSRRCRGGARCRPGQHVHRPRPVALGQRQLAAVSGSLAPLGRLCGR